MLAKNAELLVKVIMFQKKHSPPVWKELTVGYLQENTRNMAEFDCFLTLFHKGLVENGKQVEGGKKIETKIDHSLF